VFEFGSNDGTLLKAFKERGMKILGMDPAKNIADMATAEGLVGRCELTVSRPVLKAPMVSALEATI